MPMTTPAALSVRALGHAYGQRRVLDHVTFDVPVGSFTVLLGLNGAGKSTLFSLITRLFDTSEGQICVFGHDVQHDPGEALRRLGVVFQSRTLDLDLSVMQNLAYHSALHGIAPRAARRRARALLERFGLSDRSRDKVRNLSGGQMRRVEIVRALLHAPRLLLLDEPTVGLDISSRADIIAHVRQLVEDGVGVLWATHLIDEVAPQDHVVVLHQGEVLATGTAARVAQAAGAADIGAAFTGLTSARMAGDAA